ncbi:MULTISPECIES: UPF0149 family protein [Shewanella]|uniref:UPF0149 family protein n=1 Tax=Shewanella TaxID=22 RepID=UPI000B4A2AB8|nr:MULTISPECIES: UPF0149 family protein [Shewanella]MDI5837985.1 UPF0149 family protein [Shewanella xiamenensis]MDI5841818.1 UPF0149 family protein [Shewanella xiamenensis]MDI5845771.1 UPF0149 family protein [Shewanella xiamenensis]MDI5847678.1 UPF0149 family protein [Shewanella xiamenensis]MDI5853646.1 UPF0149 family protein [Shewanella xiamenensis]
MATPPSLRIDSLKIALDAAEIGQHPVEVHGALVGLICGGVDQTGDLWIKPLFDLMNDGQPLPAPLHQLVSELFQDSVARLGDFEFGFMPLLPEEEEPLSQRVEALSLWTQSFLTGIAIIQPKLNKASAEVREVIKDLAEIAQVEFDVTEDEESETAYIELLEFVRIAAIMCYSEFGPEPSHGEGDDPAVIH